jgi:hypothetical protein
MWEQTDSKRRCPLVQNPLKDCFCFEMDSLKTEHAIYYCGGNFAKCEVYKGWLRSSPGMIAGVPGIPGMKPPML